MYKIIISIAVVLISYMNASSQTESKDSIYSGRVCIITLHNGFETDGIITDLNKDTLWFKGIYATYRIPIGDIKFIRSTNEQTLSRKQDENPEEMPVDLEKRTITDDCDLYLGSGSLLKDVKLINASDSSLFAIKDGVSLDVKYDEIRKIVFKPIAPFGYGFLYGSAIGFVAGFMPFAFAKGGGHPDFSGPGFGILFGLALAVPSGLAGGVIGMLVTSDDVYQLEHGYSKSKIKRIKYIMEKHRL